jgi:hypothetical protein
MSLTSDQRRELHDIILAAFDEAELERFVLFHLDFHLNHVTRNGDLRKKAFDLIAYCERMKTSGKLISAVHQERVNNSRVVDFFRRYRESLGGGDNGATHPSNQTESRRRLPRRLAARTELVQKIQETLARRSVCILQGPSGFGKTILARMVVATIPAIRWRWIECRDWPEIPEDQEPPNPEKLYVLDQAEVHQRIFKEQVFTDFLGRLLVTTTDETVAASILARLGQYDCKDAIVPVGGLEPNESVEFLTGFVGDRLTAEQKQALVGQLCYCPLAINLMADFVGEWHARDEFPSLDCCRTATEMEKMVTRVVDAWLERLRMTEGISDRGLLVTRALCRLSFVGMSSEALAHVLGLTEEEARETIAPLLAKDLIHPNLRLEKTFWIPHDLLRNHFRSLPADEGDHTRANAYVTHVGKMVRDGRASEVGISTCLDAFIVGVRAVFKELWEKDDILGSRARFLEGLERQSKLLQEIVATTPTGRQSERLAWMFEETLVNGDCTAVIPVAHGLGNLAPIASVARILWQGARSDAKHGDDWARGACIWGAVNHWKRLTGQEQVEGLRLLEQKIQEEIQERSRDSMDLEEELKRGKNDMTDLSAGAALGALWALGRSQRAMELILSEAFARAFPQTVISDLVMAICLLDAGRAEDVWRFMSRVSGRILEGAAKTLVYEYAYRLCRVNLPYSQGSHVLETGFGKVVAAAAHSKKFGGYVQSRDPNCLPLLSGT